MNPPRPHHYTFAHRLLPEAVFSDPMGFFATMATDEAPGLLVRLWDDLGQEISASGEGEALASDGLWCQAGRVGERPAVIVRLPAPAAVSECYYAAAVLERMPTELELRGAAAPPEVRYFTLELAYSIDQDEPGTMLCGWMGERHENYGPGPEPKAAAFLGAVMEKMGA